ncbi:MAG: tetratricopeptide repeat protein, partial [Hyphomicrobium sp.]
MADDRDSLLREVDEELRREQMQKIWERYNGLILGTAALIIAGVGGYKFLESRRIAASEAAGAEFTAALQLGENNKADEATKAFEKIAASGPAGYASLAKLHIAGAHAKAGRTPEALTAYQSIINDSASDGLLRNFAQLQVATLKVGDGDFTEQQNRLKPLAGDDSAFKTTARELLGLSAFKAGKLDEARKYYEPLLIDPKASRAIQERVKIVMAEIARAESGKAAPVAPAADAPDAKPADSKA